MDEFDIIKKYFLPLTNGRKEANFLADDCAIISIASGKELIASKDLMVEDIHFKKSAKAFNIACKLLKANLSDLAANGAKPLYYLLGFSQKNLNEEFIQEFCRGLKKIGDEFKISLIGGDSVKTTDKLCFSLTIFGEITKGKSLKRNNAKDGDLILVSENIGDAFLGLQILQNKISCTNETHKEYLINAHLQPKPQIQLGQKLVKENLSKCAIDVSDGLLADLNHICQASKMDAIIDEEKIPLSDAAKFCLKNNSNIKLADLISGGEDYQLIFSANKKNQEKIIKLAKKINIKISHLGYFQKPKKMPQIKLFNENKPVKISKFGWKHY
jgi:thiamine-monophosphate kinase